MENKSRLPKLAGLRPPQVTKPMFDKLPPSTFSSLRLKRRSKSVSDLRNLVDTVLPKFSELKKIPEQTKPKKPLVPTNSTNSVASRNAVKRPAQKNEDVVKPKVARKIPDWDYKSRFTVLNEKHKVFLEKFEAMKSKLAEYEEIDEKYTKIKSEKEALDIKTESLSVENAVLKEENSVLKKKNSKFEDSLEKITTELQKTKKMYDELIVKNETNEKELERLEIIENKYNALCVEHSDLVTSFSNLTSRNENMSQKNTDLTDRLKKRNAEFTSLEKQNEFLKQAVIELEMSRRTLHNTVQDLKGTIRVFCRVRPPTPGEDEYMLCSMNYPDENSLEIRKTKESISQITSKTLESRAEFSFDHVFPPTCTQKDIFEELSLLVQSALDGYNVCIFAYGQTGSGKTYTMQGQDTPEELGLIPRAIDQIFQRIAELEKTNWKYTVRVSFLEIYNENVHDLLNPNASHNLDICFNDGKGTTVNNLTIAEIKSADYLKQLMRNALENRKVAATNFNERSSRSHAVSTLYLEGTNLEAKITCSASIHLVDLAGSESAKFSANERLAETKHINKSLSALGNVMLALHNKRKHIPYRDSKLTYLLQSSLGGNSKTLMIVNISPFEQNFGESISTLRFASKVKEVTVNTKKNRVHLSPTPTKANS